MSFNDSFQEFPMMETELVLRELQPEDAKDYFTYFSDHEVTRFWGYDCPKDIKTVASTFVRFRNAFKRKEMIAWGIASKETNQICGTCILGNFVRGSLANVSLTYLQNNGTRGSAQSIISNEWSDVA